MYTSIISLSLGAATRRFYSTFFRLALASSMLTKLHRCSSILTELATLGTQRIQSVRIPNKRIRDALASGESLERPPSRMDWTNSLPTLLRMHSGEIPGYARSSTIHPQSNLEFPNLPLDMGHTNTNLSDINVDIGDRGQSRTTSLASISKPNPILPEVVFEDQTFGYIPSEMLIPEYDPFAGPEPGADSSENSNTNISEFHLDYEPFCAYNDAMPVDPDRSNNPTGAHAAVFPQADQFWQGGDQIDPTAYTQASNPDGGGATDNIAPYNPNLDLDELTIWENPGVSVEFE